MTDNKAELSGPDLTLGVDLSTIPDGTMLLGHASGEPVLLARRGGELFAIGAICTHYGAPLNEGLLVADTVRCPWHHACFSLRTGEVLRAPALDQVSRWRVELVRDPAGENTPNENWAGVAYVREKLDRIARPSLPKTDRIPGSIVIVGGGAAGNSAAETLRQEGYSGRITMLSADQSPPCDRPNLSKGYLAGAASEESNLLRPAAFYKSHNIDLKLGARVTAIDTGNRHVSLEDGSVYAYGALLLATGAEVVRLTVPGSELPHVHYLHSLADSQALVGKAKTSRRAVVIGASFIGLEVAASLRARNIEVCVVGLEQIPMERILGAAVGTFIRTVHEQHGVTFHLGTTVESIDAESVMLKNKTRLPADLVVAGIGVRPATELAQRSGLAIDRGVTVNEYLETSVPGIFAAGDIARWPDPFTGERIRVEHFVVAERQGQTAALNMLGREEVFSAVPFFWTEQYDLGIAYTGHAEKFDEARIDGRLEARDCTITYRRDGRSLAVATIHRDLAGLRTEVDFERAIARQAGGPSCLSESNVPE